MRGLKKHKRVLQLREYLSECCFTGIPLGALGIGNPARVVAPMARLNQLRQSAAGSSQAAVTACDLSRSLCKPVYDLTGRPGQSSYHYTPQPVRLGPGLPHYLAASQPMVTDRSASIMAEAAQRFPNAENPMAAMMAEEMKKIMASGAASA